MLGGPGLSGAYRHDLIFMKKVPVLVLAWSKGKPTVTIALTAALLEGPADGDDEEYIYSEPVVHPEAQAMYGNYASRDALLAATQYVEPHSEPVQDRPLARRQWRRDR